MLLSLVLTYKYWFIFLGTMIGGEFVVVPVVYLASIGGLNILYTVLAILAASLVADTFWYFIGKHLPAEKIGRLPILRSNPEFKDKVRRFFEQNGLFAVFLSKFVYGTRTLTQTMSGVYEIGYFKYILSGLSGVSAWTLLIFALSYTLNLGVESLRDTASSIQISFAVLVLAIIVFHLVARHFFKKKVE